MITNGGYIYILYSNNKLNVYLQSRGQDMIVRMHTDVILIKPWLNLCVHIN